MRFWSACVAMLAAMAVIVGFGVIPAHAAETTTDKPTVQTPEDKALVYFVRPKRAPTTFLYIDDEFVGVLENNSFTYALVEEGQHALWTFSTVEFKTRWLKALVTSLVPSQWEGSEFEVVRGRTYYFGFANPANTPNTHVQLDEKEGAEWIDKVKFYTTATDKEAQASAIHLAERGTWIVEQFEASYIKVADYPTPQAPADVTGLIRVDANTEVSLELVQNLWSERDSSGDEVWLRVTKDVASAEGVWLREGTLVLGLLRHAQGGQSSPRGGVLEVAIPAVVAVDSTVVPTQGAIKESGGESRKGSWAEGNFKRALASFALDPKTVEWFAGFSSGPGSGTDPGPVGGESAYLPIGSAATIYTRDPVWIVPGSRATESDEEGSSPPTLRLRVATKTIRFPQPA